MNSLDALHAGASGILVLGIHRPIIQSILDFDYLCGRSAPSIPAIITANTKAQKFFFGSDEILIPCFSDVREVPSTLKNKIQWMLNVQSGRNALRTTTAFFETFPAALGGTIFAENVPEQHTTEIIRRFGTQKIILGPASVGFLVPGQLKLGAIGGVDLSGAGISELLTPGEVAVVSTSGGMTNELIQILHKAGKKISFAVSLGGDRFPITDIKKILEIAQADKHTKALVYFGELGGTDEYEIVRYIKERKFTKPVIGLIAGVIDEMFAEHVQFGHAKALVVTHDESARAKREALRAAGVTAPDSFKKFLASLAQLPPGSASATVVNTSLLMDRKKSILSTRNILDQNSERHFVTGKRLAKQQPYAYIRVVLEALLGKKIKSEVTLAFTEAVFELLLDHGGAVSGAVNTMITARAGKDMATSLAAGLLTVGPRFGGALNAAAGYWRRGVVTKQGPGAFVEEMAKNKVLIPGIGHLKYRIGIPDPRVEALSQFASLLKQHRHFDFAQAVAKITGIKSGNLILNIDGAIAALFLDMLEVCEKISTDEIDALIEAEFFNALFIIPRSVGFVAHFLEQKRNDEGLFRLPEDLLFVRTSKKEKRGL